jgi:hypothetical protein
VDHIRECASSGALSSLRISGNRRDETKRAHA